MGRVSRSMGGAGEGLLLAVLLILFLISTVKTLKAEDFVFDGQIRERFEALNGMNKLAYGDHSIDARGNVVGDSNDRMLLQRIIAGFSYTQNEHFRYNLHMYDARVWGWSLNAGDFVKNPNTPDEYVMDPNEAYFELYDANIEIRDLVVKGFSTILGRQKIWYGDKRIFGPGDWGNSIGWVWDAGKFSYKRGGNFIDAWYGQTKTKDPDSFSLVHKHAYQGVGLYSHYQIADGCAVEPFFAWKNNLFHEVVPEEELYYVGARFYEKNFHGFNWDFTYARECGSNGEKSVQAFGYVAKVGYRFENIPMKPNLVVGRVFASGDNNLNDGTVKTFQPPFGSTDGSHYGRMDIMSWSNLEDNQVNVYLAPLENLYMKVAYHHFSIDKWEDKWRYYGYVNKPGNEYTHLGDEVDLVVKYKYSKEWEFQFIYAYFMDGDFVKYNVENNNADRLFLQCTYRFQFW